MSQVQVNLRLDPEELAAIDGLRGLVPRNAWIRQLVRDACVAASHSELPVGPVAMPEPPQTVAEDPPLTRLQRAERQREQFRVAQKGGPNRA